MPLAALFLRGAKVNADFREALFDASNRAGVSPNEFCIMAAAEKLSRSGAGFSGVFRPGDFSGLPFDGPAR